MDGSDKDLNFGFGLDSGRDNDGKNEVFVKVLAGFNVGER